MSSKNSPSGFGTAKNKQYQDKQSALVASCIREGRWTDAINIYSRSPKIHSASMSLIDELFNSAVNAANNNNNFLSLTLHCQLLAASPNHTKGLRNFAIILRRLQYYKDAKNYIDKYLELLPDCINGLNTLGTILNDLGLNHAAIEAYQNVLKVDPFHAMANSNIATEYHLLAKIDLAYIHSSRAIASNPLFPTIWLDHLTHVNRVCDFDRKHSIDWWYILKQLPPVLASTSFLQLLTLCETPKDYEKFQNIVRMWGDDKSLQSSVNPLPPLNSFFHSSKKLRIGFISADFRDHSVARFILPLFQHLDKDRYSLHCYSTYLAKDSWRTQFEHLSDSIRDVGALSPHKLCQVIRDDHIQILFDLTGFTNNSRTGALAWRAAPVQVSWLGFPGTIGLPEMDYLFLDQYLAPIENSLVFEKLLLTKGSTICFAELQDIPITSTIPEISRGYLTLGTLNNSYKFTRASIYRWAQVLHAIPLSKFLFVRREFDSYLLRQNILKMFSEFDIDTSRIHFYNNRADNRHYLDCYNEIDFTLDTYPVTGGTTTIDSLWMGVPVVSLEGSNIHQRVCSSILKHAGYPEWVAHSDEEYLEISIKLAFDQAYRIDLRHKLRSTLKLSPLCDVKKFAQDFANCIEQVYSSSPMT